MPERELAWLVGRTDAPDWQQPVVEVDAPARDERPNVAHRRRFPGRYPASKCLNDTCLFGDQAFGGGVALDERASKAYYVCLGCNDRWPADT